MADEANDQSLVPLDGETARDYTERLNEAGIRKYTGLERYFGYSRRAAKGMWIASEQFNIRFAYEQWSVRRARSDDGYGATNWLKRKYSLTDEQAAVVAAEFESGNREGLLKVLRFGDIARRLVTSECVEEMERKGAFE
ncbi:hypothetical protein AADZ90_011695 [Aestuariibius sp. 2305UL40-4]|uniref:hypothetical protein n=1 Tax=Aestuariibius violaceus TaxID=3234132 RepID=UPI00345EB2D5